MKYGVTKWRRISFFNHIYDDARHKESGTVNFLQKNSQKIEFCKNFIIFAA